jgi:hypothetical protein
LQAEREFYEGMLTAVGLDGKRVISDTTEELVKDILEQSREPGQFVDVASRKSSFRLNRRLFEKRLEEDRKYHDAFLKYKQLERDAWFLRYGDYLAISLADLRGIAKSLDKTSKPAQRSPTSGI